MPELRDALREATNKLGILAGNPQLIAFDAMLTSYPTLTVAGAIGFGVNPANAFAGAAATIEVIANGANVPTFTGITATGSYVNTAGAVNRIEFECLPSGPGSALAFYAKIGNGGGAAPVTSVAGKTGTVTLVKADVGLGAVDNTADADKPVSSAVQNAINGRQPLDSDLTAIAGLTTNGILERAGPGTAGTIAVTPVGRALMTPVDQAAGRGAIGLGTLATQNSNAVNITGGTAGFTGFFDSSADLPLGVYLGNEGTPRIVFSFGAAATAWSIDNVMGAFRWFTPGVVRLTLDATTSQLTLFGPLQFNGGATQTASLRGSKTIGTPSATDTITVVGAQVGDIVSVSRGKDAFISAANTVQFDSTGLGGVLVSAIVGRFV